MRAYLTAGLVSLSCATCGSAVLGQQPLWFTPQTLSPTHSTATPGSIPHSPDQAPDRNWLQAISKSPQAKTEQLNRGTKLGSNKFGSDASAQSKYPSSLSKRFGDLLSKPGTRLAIAMGNEQATVVTAGAEDPTNSSTPSVIPWETVRKPNEFSFAEFDASVAQSQILGARRTRSTQVSEMTPHMPSLQDTQPITEQVNTATRESNDSEQPTQRVPAQLASSARPQRVVSEDLSLVLPIPADKLMFQAPTEAPGKQTAVNTPSRTGERLAGLPAPFVRTMETSRVATLTQQDTSVNNNVPQAPKALATPNSTPPEPLETTNPTRPEPAVVGRISDKSSDDESNDPNNGSDKSTRNSAVDETPLLNTESMIGPMKGADQLFGRLDLVNDLRGLASLAQEGPREDSYQYSWMPTPYTWISPAFYHHPLYFEQPNLERYGIGRARVVQPLLSSVHFFGSIPLIPYKTLTHHPRERVYTLGQGRPGNCVPIQGAVILGQSTVGEVSMFWEECSGYR